MSETITYEKLNLDPCTENLQSAMLLNIFDVFSVSRIILLQSQFDTDTACIISAKWNWLSSQSVSVDLHPNLSIQRFNPMAFSAVHLLSPHIQLSEFFSHFFFLLYLQSQIQSTWQWTVQRHGQDWGSGRMVAGASVRVLCAHISPLHKYIWL